MTLMKMNMERYIDILNRLLSYDIASRSGDNFDKATWMQKKSRLRNLDELVNRILKPSTELLMNKKGGELVLDDELIGSRAQDAESRNHSQRKAGTIKISLLQIVVFVIS